MNFTQNLFWKLKIPKLFVVFTYKYLIITPRGSKILEIKTFTLVEKVSLRDRSNDPREKA